MSPPGTAPPRQVTALRNRIAELEDEVKLRDQLHRVRERVEELELEVKCKDALLAARARREKDEDQAALARVEAAEKPLTAAGENLTKKLGDGWVPLPLLPSSRQDGNPLGSSRSKRFTARGTSRAASVLSGSTCLHSVREDLESRASRASFSSTASWRTPTSHRARIRSQSQTPLVRMSGAPPLQHGGFTRFANVAGFVPDQKSCEGVTAGMGMCMNAPKRAPRHVGPQMPRNTDMRVLPINEYDHAYDSRHAPSAQPGFRKSIDGLNYA